jgi:hypothetical protein
MNKQYPELITDNGLGKATVVTSRHKTESSLVRSPERASISPAKSNGNASRNPYYYYYYSKVIELLQRVCVGLKLPCISPHLYPPRFFAFYT